MKIVIDTNVLISATFWQGISNLIIKKVEKKEFELIISKGIIEEFIKVLNYDEIQNKIKDKNLEIMWSVEKIISISTLVQPLNKLNLINIDPSDNKFLECAVEGNAKYILSYDRHLLDLKEFNNIKILTPEEFLNITKEK